MNGVRQSILQQVEQPIGKRQHDGRLRPAHVQERFGQPPD